MPGHRRGKKQHVFHHQDGLVGRDIFLCNIHDRLHDCVEIHRQGEMAEARSVDFCPLSTGKMAKVAAIVVLFASLRTPPLTRHNVSPPLFPQS